MTYSANFQQDALHCLNTTVVGMLNGVAYNLVQVTGPLMNYQGSNSNTGVQQAWYVLGESY